MVDRCNRILSRIYVRTREVDGSMDTPCWEWTGPTSGNGRGGGYGRMSLDGFTVAVHRVVWVCVNGYLPSKKHIDHKCRNRLCCRPEHLVAVTHKQNCRLRDEAARMIDGEIEE